MVFQSLFVTALPLHAEMNQESTDEQALFEQEMQDLDEGTADLYSLLFKVDWLTFDFENKNNFDSLYESRRKEHREMTKKKVWVKLDLKTR